MNNSLKVNRFHRVNKVMNNRNMTTPEVRKNFIGGVLDEKKLLTECSAEELELLLIALGENPNEEAKPA